MKAALFALLIIGIIGGTFAVECYQCNDVGEGGKCDDTFTPDADSPKNTCDGKCSKTKTSLGDKTSTISRSCSTNCQDMGCHDLLGVTTCSLCCEGDLCNSAGAIAVNLVAMSTMVAIAMAMTL